MGKGYRIVWHDGEQDTIVVGQFGDVVNFVRATPKKWVHGPALVHPVEDGESREPREWIGYCLWCTGPVVLRADRLAPGDDPRKWPEEKWVQFCQRGCHAERERWYG